MDAHGGQALLVLEDVERARRDSGQTPGALAAIGEIRDRAADLERRLSASAVNAIAQRAAGYTLKELMEYVGHSDLQMVQRYTKLLPGFRCVLALRRGLWGLGDRKGDITAQPAPTCGPWRRRRSLTRKTDDEVRGLACG